MIVTFLLSCSFTFASAGEKGSGGNMKFSGCGGGMMIHSGFVYGKPVSFQSVSGKGVDMVVRGVPVGIGGAAKAVFGRHLRVGGEGYVSRLKYGPHKSSETIGWGGLLADCVWTRGRWSWFAGGTVGGGSVTNITLLSDMSPDFVLEDGTSSYRKYGFVALVPFAGVEYALTERVRLTAKLDWMFNVSNPQPDFVTGPRIYIGFMFCHSRKL